MDYHQKYLKYKAKYLELKKQLEGSGPDSNPESNPESRIGEPGSRIMRRLRKERDSQLPIQLEERERLQKVEESRQNEEKRRQEWMQKQEEIRKEEEKIRKEEEEWKNLYMKLEIEDLKKWIKTLTDQQILDLPYKSKYFPHPRSVSDDWFYMQSYEDFDKELKKIKAQIQKKLDIETDDEKLARRQRENYESSKELNELMGWNRYY